MSFGGIDWREDDEPPEGNVLGLILIALVVAGIVYVLLTHAGGRLL